jgi:ATP-dependent protease HslVU (ClpYQ) ATPase subunit
MNTKEKEITGDYEELLKSGELEEFTIEVKIPETKKNPQIEGFPEIIMEALQRKTFKTKKMKIKDARKIIKDTEIDKLIGIQFLILP